MEKINLIKAEEAQKWESYRIVPAIPWICSSWLYLLISYPVIPGKPPFDRNSLAKTAIPRKVVSHDKPSTPPNAPDGPAGSPLPVLAFVTSE